MGVFDVVRSLFGGRPAPKKKPPSLADVAGLTTTKYASVEGWRSSQIEKYGTRWRLPFDLSAPAVDASAMRLGLRGDTLLSLVRSTPRLLPVHVWGSDLGWRSGRRRTDWAGILRAGGYSEGDVVDRRGILLHCALDPTEWVPHPYCPPEWALTDYQAFESYIYGNDEAYVMARRWQAENNAALTEKLRERLRSYPLLVSGRCLCNVARDRAHVAIAYPLESTKELGIQTVWKGEADLVALVRENFPDCEREYSAAWLGAQRLDVFIPSLNVAIEYQGEQHSRPVDYFGGRKGLKETRGRDRRKAVACRNAGVVLVEWHYYERLDSETLFKKLRIAGVVP